MRIHQEIADYVSQDTRNKIVFCKCPIEGIEFLNVGHDLSALLSDNALNNMDAHRNLLSVSSKNATNIGQYLALENVGILFEPELKLDIRNLLDIYSKNQCLIIKSNAELSVEKLCWLTSADGIQINLSGLSFIEINI